MNKFIGNGYSNSDDKNRASTQGSCVANLCYGDTASSCTGNLCGVNEHSGCMFFACGFREADN